MALTGVQRQKRYRARRKRILFADVFAGLCRLGLGDTDCAHVLGVELAEFTAWLTEFPEWRVELEAGRAKARPSARELLREHAKAGGLAGVRAAIALSRMPEDVIQRPAGQAERPALDYSRLTTDELEVLLRLQRKLGLPAS